LGMSDQTRERWWNKMASKSSSFFIFLQFVHLILSLFVAKKFNQRYRNMHGYTLLKTRRKSLTKSYVSVQTVQGKN
jgi:hypothetical protein